MQVFKPSLIFVRREGEQEEAFLGHGRGTSGA